MTRTLFGREVKAMDSSNRRQIGAVEGVWEASCDELGGTDDVGCVLCKG